MCQTISSNDPQIQINFDRIPISALRHPTNCFLSQSLNTKKILLAENNYPRDWRGFAYLAGLNSSCIPLKEPDPMLKVLTLWNDNEQASFQDILEILGQIDRWDVVNDIIDILTQDALAYSCMTSQNANFKIEPDCVIIRSNFETAQQSILSEEETVSIVEQLVQKDSSQNLEILQEIKTIQNNVIVTRSDVDRAERNLPLERYDAFLLYADADLPFAEELVNRMENHPQFKFVLCLKDRDILGGVSFEHDTVMSLIRERCNRLIVIVSKAFLASSLNEFFVQYAAALQIEKGCRKLIPCLYENCEVPNVLNCFSSIKYKQTGGFYDFWNRLSDSIRAGRLQYSKTMNGLADSSFVSSGQNGDANAILDLKSEKCIPINEILSTYSDINVLCRTSRKSKSKKWYKRIKRRLLRISCFSS